MNNLNCSTRQQAGQKVGMTGILVNAVLFIAKCAMGFAGNSMSVLADALNNFMDCASSLATMLGFKLCARPADSHHPNGHGRMEYISGFIVSFLVMTTALSFGKKAISRIVEPQLADMPVKLLWIPLAAIIMKLFLAWYTRRVNKKIESAALKAMFKDSISDAVLTGMTLVSLLLSPFTALPLDGVFSLIISAVILWSGITSFLEHLDILIGKGQDQKVTEQITQIILTRKEIFREILSINTFDYGPERQFAVIQVLLREDLCQKTVQSEVQTIIQALKRKLNLEAAIYWAGNIGEQYEMILPQQ